MPLRTVEAWNKRAVATNGYAHIERAALEIAGDNGSINRDRSEKSFRATLRWHLQTCPYEDEQLRVIDEWLGTLSDDELQIACAGEETEMNQLLAGSPPFTAALLTEIFDRVCCA